MALSVSLIYFPPPTTNEISTEPREAHRAGGGDITSGARGRQETRVGRQAAPLQPGPRLLPQSPAAEAFFSPLLPGRSRTSEETKVRLQGQQGRGRTRSERCHCKNGDPLPQPQGMNWNTPSCSFPCAQDVEQSGIHGPSLQLWAQDGEARPHQTVSEPGAHAGGAASA